MDQFKSRQTEVGRHIYLYHKVCPNFDPTRREWVQLNCIRTENGRCNELLTRSKIRNDVAYDCGYPWQTIEHILLTDVQAELLMEPINDIFMKSHQ